MRDQEEIRERAKKEAKQDEAYKEKVSGSGLNSSGIRRKVLEWVLDEEVTAE